jgi:hypothetical protein
MPTSFANLPVTRRVAVGASATGQGLDGVPELTRTALEALAAADWTVSDAPPYIPPHDYDRALPAGDAWKACWGYDAAARTERGACGAVCYTFAVPADALTGAACNITSIGARVQGDRYLDAGVDMHVLLSDSATPPTVAELLARAPEIMGLCATGDQTDPPNQRHGVSATATITPSAAATAYIHIALLLHDYLGTRGAWIEGGAMLVGGAATGGAGGVTVEFSRDVESSELPVGSLYLVTGTASSTQHSSATTNIPAFSATIEMPYWRDAAGRAPALADLPGVLPIMASGIVPLSSAAWRFAASNANLDNYASGSLLLADSASTPRLALTALAYYVAPILTRRRVRVSVSVTGPGGSSAMIRAALVAGSSIPADGIAWTDVAQSTVPWAQVVRGGGDELVGTADAVVAIPDAGSVTIQIDIPVSVAPTTPFVWLVLLPLTGGISLRQPSDTPWALSIYP